MKFLGYEEKPKVLAKVTYSAMPAKLVPASFKPGAEFQNSLNPAFGRIEFRVALRPENHAAQGFTHELFIEKTRAIRQVS
jgi:hypothetical protein